MEREKTIINLVIVISIVCMFIISCQKTKIEYDKDIGPITLKDKVIHSYSVNYKKDLDIKDVTRMADQVMELSGKKWKIKDISEANESHVMLKNENDPSASFEMDKRTGNFLYNGGLAEYRKEANTPDLISGEKAATVALQHLEKLSLFPSKKEMNLVHIGGLGMGVLKKDGTTVKYDKLITVRYDRKLDDIPVMGESRIVVNMGERGKLAGMIYYWGDIVEKKKIESGELVDDSEIKKVLESRLIAASEGAKRMIVQKADLVLYDDGKGRIEPAFHIQARLFYEKAAGKGEEEIQKYDIPYDYYIPVLKKPLAYYPYMETTEISPTDGRKIDIDPKDDE
jgi:hypothetical protein